MVDPIITPIVIGAAAAWAIIETVHNICKIIAKLVDIYERTGTNHTDIHGAAYY